MIQSIARLMPKWGAVFLAVIALAACAGGAVVPLDGPSPPTATITATVPAVTLVPIAVASSPTVTPPPATPTPSGPPAPADDFGPAPEISTEVWLNGDQPLRLADLRGQVVLIDFWTYG